MKKIFLLIILCTQIAFAQTALLYGSKTGLRKGNSSGDDLRTILNQIDDINEFTHYNNTLYWINNSGVFFLDDDNKVELLTDGISGDEIFIYNDVIYFSNDHQILNYNLSSQTQEIVFELSNSDGFRKIEFNDENQKIYFQNSLSDNLFSINIDGSDFQMVIPLVHDFTISDTNIYWAPTDQGDSVLLQSSNLFGSATEDLTSFLYNKNSFFEISASTIGSIDYIFYEYRFTSTNPFEINRFNVSSSSFSTIDTQVSGVIAFEHLYSINGEIYYFTQISNESNEIKRDNVVVATNEINENSDLFFTDSNIIVSLDTQINRYDYNGNFESVLFETNSSPDRIDGFAYNENTNTIFYTQDNKIFKQEIGGNVIYTLYDANNDNIEITDILSTSSRIYWKELETGGNQISRVKYINQSAVNNADIVTDYTSVNVFSNDFVFYESNFYGIFDGVFRYNFSTNSEDYIEFNSNLFYTALSIYNDKIYALESGSIFEMDIDGSNKSSVLSNSVITPEGGGIRNYVGLFAIMGTTNENVPSNNICDTAISLNVGNSFDENAVIASNTNATPSFENSCSSFTSDNDIWYAVTVPDTGHLFIETKSNLDHVEDTNLIIYEGGCNSLIVRVCNSGTGDDNFSKVIIQDNPGTELFIRSIDNTNNSGSYKLSAYTSITGPLGDIPSNPIDLMVGNDFEDQQKYISMIDYTTSGISAPPNCGSSAVEKDVWFTTRIPDSGEINIGTGFISNVSGIISVITVYAIISGNVSYVGCTDSQEITLQGPADTLLLFRVHDFSNSNITGAFSVSTFHETVLSVVDFYIEDNSFELYPNPVSAEQSILTLTRKDNLIKAEVSIYNSKAKLIKKQEIPNLNNNIEINVKELSNGIYFIVLEDENGRYSKKFIKQ